MIRLNVKNFNETLKNLDTKSQKIFGALVEAHSDVSSRAVKTLKRGLSDRHGRNPSSKDYETSPKGALPYAHTLRLRDSIGFKILASGKKVKSQVGSGTMGNTIKYAKFLEGNGKGKRPFLWYIESVYNTNALKEAFLRNLRGNK